MCLDSVVISLLIFVAFCYSPPKGGKPCKQLIVVTICLTRFGNFWSHTFQAKKEPEASLPVITEIFLMQFFGSCEQVRRAEICRLIMRTGKIPIADSVGGEIVACGKIARNSYF